MTVPGSFVSELVAVGVLMALLFAAEACLGTVLPRRFPAYDALDGPRPAQLRVRGLEALGSAYLCAGGVLGALAFASSRANYITGGGPYPHAHCLALVAFYLFMTGRMLVVRGYAGALYVHHMIMVVGLLCCLYFDVLYFYVLLSAVPAGSAVVRNARWASRVSAGAFPAPAPLLAAALVLLLELPAPLAGFVHLFAVGLRDGHIPGAAWALVIAPAMASTAMATWFVAGAFREACRRDPSRQAVPESA
jgi:hypothetical protein